MFLENANPAPADTTEVIDTIASLAEAAQAPELDISEIDLLGEEAELIGILAEAAEEAQNLERAMFKLEHRARMDAALAESDDTLVEAFDALTEAGLADKLKSGIDKTANAASAAKARIQSGAAAAKDKMGAVADAAKDKAGSAADAVKDKASAGADRVKAAADRVKAGSSEFIKRRIEQIKALYARIKAWVIKHLDGIVLKVFGPRKKWLEAHKAELSGKSSFGDAKVSVMKGATSANATKLVSDSEKALVAITKAAANPSTDAEGQRRTAAEAIGGSAGDTIPAAVQKHFGIGETEEVALSSGLVAEMIKVAEITFSNVEKIKAHSRNADLLVKVAENQAVAASGDAKSAQAVIASVQTAGPLVSQIIGAISSANTAMNARAMAVLTAARHAGGQKAVTESAEDEAAAAAAAAAAEAPEASVLDQYMS